MTQPNEKWRKWTLWYSKSAAEWRTTDQPWHKPTNNDEIEVVEISAVEALKVELEEAKGTLNLKEDEYIQQVGTWKIIQRLEEQRDQLKAHEIEVYTEMSAEIERLKLLAESLTLKCTEYEGALEFIGHECLHSHENCPTREQMQLKARQALEKKDE